MHFLIIVVLLAATSCTARPRQPLEVGSNPFILWGQDAYHGQFPWQMSIERFNGKTWQHSCGGILLSSTKVLTAVFCVQGMGLQYLRVIAGLHDRLNQQYTQTSYVERVIAHELYNQGDAAFSNDIATVHLVTPIETNSIVSFARLPVDDSESFEGSSCTISGWGFPSGSGPNPYVLQYANVDVLAMDDCSDRLSDTPGARVGSGHVCVYDRTEVSGACQGDFGGPLNCQTSQGIVVAGVASWSIQGGADCLTTRPSVYTRISVYLDWIDKN